MKYLPLLLLLLLCTCGRALEKEVAEIPTTTPGLSLTDTLFGQTPDGPVTKYTLQNEHVMQVSSGPLYTSDASDELHWGDLLGRATWKKTT